MGARSVSPNEKHRAFRDDLIGVVRKHGDEMKAEELLAIAAHFVGQLVALQDQRTMTSARAMQIVAHNIEVGNAEIIDSLLQTTPRDNEAIECASEEPPPVDRSRRVMMDGGPVTDDHREINPATGQQKGYVVLSAEERDKGFVRPVRCSYVHKPCGGLTTMALPIAETYARDPGFYSGTFCCGCRAHFPLDQFVWAGTEAQVGS
ncbi:MAG: hypothetical protein AB7P23_05670 [Amphiplicatus sp.]